LSHQLLQLYHSRLLLLAPQELQRGQELLLLLLESPSQVLLVEEAPTPGASPR